MGNTDGETVMTRNVTNNRALLLAVCAAGVITSSCMQPMAPEPDEDVTDVSMVGLAFVPKTVTIRAGERVRWTNLETLPIPHTATSGDPDDDAVGEVFVSGTLGSGQSFTIQFDEPGSFEYYCEFHPFVPAMRNALVIVEE